MNTHWLLTLSVLSLALVFLVGCESGNNDRVIKTNIEFRADGYLDFVRPDGSIITRIAIEFAVGDSAQARGLMDRRSLPARGGMLFINDDEADRNFWMKSTPISLDIIFVRADSSILNIEQGTRPYSEDYVKSTGPAQYIVEVRSGFTKKYGINESAKIRWKQQ